MSTAPWTPEQAATVLSVKDVHLRYTRGIDRLDLDLVRSAFHPDAVLDHGGFVGSVEELLPYARGVLEQFETTSHVVGNQLVTLGDDGTAGMESYTRAYHRMPPEADGGAVEWVMNIRYVDRLALDGEGWRIVHRRLVTDTSRSTKVYPDDKGGGGRVMGRRGPADVSYEVL